MPDLLIIYNIEAWVHPSRVQAVLEEIEQALAKSEFVSDFGVDLDRDE